MRSALSLEYTAQEGGLNRNTAYHPLTIEGKKTAGLEIFAQSGMRVPDVIAVSAGDGVILHGVFKAFTDLRAAGLIDKLPRLALCPGGIVGCDPPLLHHGDLRGCSEPGDRGRFHLRSHAQQRAHGAACAHRIQRHVGDGDRR